MFGLSSAAFIAKLSCKEGKASNGETASRFFFYCDFNHV
jgi:hypothetical protein